MNVRRVVVWPALLVALAVACGDPGSAGSGTSGIEGTALVGPQCPVEQENSPCPDAPFEGQFGVVEASSGDEVATFRSDEDGRFQVALEPGAYVVELKASYGSLPFAAPVEVTVRPGRFTEVTIQLDSGIR